MSSDAFGNAVTGADPDAVRAIDDFVVGLLSYHPRALNILAAADRTDAPPLVRIYAGFLQLLAEATGADDAARPYLDHLDPGAMSAREAALAEVLEAWIADDIDRVVATLDRVVADHPRDLGSLKLLHYHLFNRGDFPAMLRVARAVVVADPALPYAHGMLAFAYEQLHLLDHAEAAARRALEIVPEDPWAEHAIAHVALTQGRIDEGAALLESWAPAWAPLNSFIVTHLWWHLALFYLSQGRDADALAAYDDHVWSHAKDYSQDQIGAVSLLARLELAGIDVGHRWQELGDYLAVRADDVVQPFLSVQYLYGLARAGRAEADGLLAAIGQASQQGPEHSRAVWHDAARPLAEGLMAHARGQFDLASARLSEALPRLVRLGGSHAQRDLFDQLLLDANIRSGHLIEAQQQLESRRAHDPNGVALNRLLADVYRRLDLPVEAREASDRIAQRLAA